MALKIKQKVEIANQVNDVASQAVSAVVVGYSGLKSSDMTELRAKAREAKVIIKVVKNTLAVKAVAGTQYECLQEKLVGAVFLAFSLHEPGAAARLLQNYAKSNSQVKLVAAAIDGQLYEGAKIDIIARLPTKDEAIARLMMVMNAPITKLVRTLAEPYAKLVRALAAVRDVKKQG